MQSGNENGLLATKSCRLATKTAFCSRLRGKAATEPGLVWGDGTNDLLIFRNTSMFVAVFVDVTSKYRFRSTQRAFFVEATNKNGVSSTQRGVFVEATGNHTSRGWKTNCRRPVRECRQ